MKKSKKKIVKLESIDDHIKELCKKSPEFKKAYLAEKKRVSKLVKLIDDYTKPFGYSLKEKSARLGLAMMISLEMDWLGEKNEVFSFRTSRYEM